MTEDLILVDSNDQQTGTAEKMDAHRRGVLHRAFSVFVFHPDGRLLMQRRADGKYHSAGLWSNTACGHPRPGENTLDAARRRLAEEFGFDAALTKAFDFTYRVPLGDLWEHELDHVFVATLDAEPNPDANEIGAWAWRDVPEMLRELDTGSAEFSEWFPLALRELVARGFAPRT